MSVIIVHEFKIIGIKHYKSYVRKFTILHLPVELKLIVLICGSVFDKGHGIPVNKLRQPVIKGSELKVHRISPKDPVQGKLEIIIDILLKVI